MIYFDVTQASSWRHASGLARVSDRLLAELGDSASGLRWPELASAPRKNDWILTPELFSQEERPGLLSFLEHRPCRVAAIYHDAIPLKHPAITWPESVARHPSYMKLLSRFDRVWAVSAASRDELLEFWRWQGVDRSPPVEVLALGADGPGIPRALAPGHLRGGPGLLVSVGILEPRKNQALILDACQALREDGVEMELHLVGRVNPHFGKPIAQKIVELRRNWPGLTHHVGMKDHKLAELIRSARATVFPTIAEGCGLPLLESLWMGTPCVCSDIPPVLENAAAGGCAPVEGNGLEGWKGALRHVLKDDAYRGRLVVEALTRPLPTWAQAAQTLREALS